MQYSRAEYAKILAAQQEVSRAEEDYHRLRAAYVETARNEPGHDVALAMIGADMERAHMHLQFLIGLPDGTFSHTQSQATVVPLAAEQPAEESA